MQRQRISFDKLALRRRLKLVRYGDDIMVCCRTKEEAEATLTLIEKLLAKLDLALNPRKTAIVHAEKGFRFLGQDLYMTRTEDGEQRLLGWPPEPERQPVPALPVAASATAVEAPVDSHD